jgi:hypothetical protein
MLAQTLFIPVHNEQGSPKQLICDPPPAYAQRRDYCVSIVSFTHALDECPNPCGCSPARNEMSWQTVLTLLTTLTVVARFVANELSLIVCVPDRPSRLKDNSMPSMRRNVCARRRRPARTPGFFGQPALLFEILIAARRRSEAVPAQLPRSAMSLRTQTAIGSVSMIPSTAALRFAS